MSRVWPIRTFTLVALGTTTSLLGCTAVLTAGDDGGASGPDDGPNSPGSIDGAPLPPEDCSEADEPFVAKSLVRRLTPRQFDRSATSLLESPAHHGETFPTPTREAGYDNQAASQHVQRAEVDAWERAAEELADTMLDASPLLSDCRADGANFETCFLETLPKLARRLLRRSVSKEDLARYEAFFAERRAESDARRAAKLTLETLWLSPRFLFVVEEGSASEEDPSLRRLDGFEVASRLSFALWNEAPSEELLDAAASGELDSPDAVRKRAAEMLRDARAVDVAVDFHSQWIDLKEVDSMILPEGVADSVRESARIEVEKFLEHWFSEGSASMPELFVSRVSWLDEALGSYYGVDASGSGALVALPESERAGLLTRAVFLGTHSIPPTRGDFILDRVLCSPVPPLSIVPPPAPDLGPSATTRERFEKHSEDPCAAACHGVLDPIGFAFENYDATGTYRVEENGFPVDASTELPFAPETGLDGPVQNAIELSEAIAQSPMAADCWAENWFRYVHGRGASEVDRCSLEHARASLRDSGGDARKLLEAMTTTDAFLYVRKD